VVTLIDSERATGPIDVASEVQQLYRKKTFTEFGGALLCVSPPSRYSSTLTTLLEPDCGFTPRPAVTPDDAAAAIARVTLSLVDTIVPLAGPNTNRFTASRTPIDITQVRRRRPKQNP
jgi:hypothetical protein